MFLPEGKDAVDEDDADDGHAEPRHALARIEMVGDKGQRGTDPQDDREEVRELAGEAQQNTLAAYFLDVVRSELRPAAHRFGRRQACRRGAQAGQGRFGVKPINLHRTLAGGESMDLGPRQVLQGGRDIPVECDPSLVSEQALHVITKAFQLGRGASAFLRACLFEEERSISRLASGPGASV